jgi:hypothetical protein
MFVTQANFVEYWPIVNTIWYDPFYPRYDNDSLGNLRCHADQHPFRLGKICGSVKVRLLHYFQATTAAERMLPTGSNK